MSVTPDSDEVTLMQRIASGDVQAYRALSETELPKIFRFAQRVLGNAQEAEDVAQETFLRLWQHADHWTPKARVTTWLHRIAKNQCLDRLRKRRPTDGDAVDQLPASTHPAGILQRKQQAQAVRTALDALPVRQRMALSLVHYEGLSQRDAAQVLEIKVEALESLLARGRRTLRETLQRWLQDTESQ